MATKDAIRRKPKRKLTLSKQTIRDLNPRKGKVDAVRAGGARTPGCGGYSEP
jgi:hypothetical protein